MIRIDLKRNRLIPKKGAVNRKRMGFALPPQTYRKVKQFTQDVGLIATIIICSGLSYVCTLFASQWKTLLVNQHRDQMRNLEEKLLAVSSEVSKYSSYQQEIQSYEEQKKIANERLGTVKDLLEQRSAPVQLLDTIGQSLPPKTWVSTLDMNLVQEPGAVNLSGVSFSNEEISDFVDRLSESVNLSDIALEEVGSRSEEKIEYKSFTVTAKPKLKWLSRTVATATKGVAPAEKK